MVQEIAGPGISTGGDRKVLEQTQFQFLEEARLCRPSLIAQVTSSEKALGSKQPEHTPSERKFDASVESGSAFKSWSIDATKKTLERTDSSVSNGSIVAAIRNRYGRTVSGWYLIL
jgi:hypothetical protein